MVTVKHSLRERPWRKRCGLLLAVKTAPTDAAVEHVVD